VLSWGVKWARSVEAMGLVRERGGVACHDGFCGPVGECGGEDTYVCSGHVASVPGGVHDFV
jgi:hypothetical protein